MTNEGVIKLVTAVYLWFNQIANPAVDFQMVDLEKYFTPDFVMEMNDTVTTSNYDSLFKHFKKFREGKYSLTIQLPFKEILVSEDQKKCVVRYSIMKTYPNNVNKELKVIAIWHISEDGRLKRMNEVVFYEKENE